MPIPWLLLLQSLHNLIMILLMLPSLVMRLKPCDTLCPVSTLLLPLLHHHLLSQAHQLLHSTLVFLFLVSLGSSIQGLLITWLVSLFFSSYSICFEKDKICTTYWSYSFVADKGSIPTTSTQPLYYVLHVPNFTLNLLLISHLTKSLNYSVTFFPLIVCFRRTCRQRGWLVGGMRTTAYIFLMFPHTYHSFKFLE